MKKALITGITGQDGFYLAEHLLSCGYVVYGFGRKRSVMDSHLLKSLPGLSFCYGDLGDFATIYEALRSVQPDEIYNLASQSHPGESWERSLETGDTTAMGAHRLFEGARQVCKSARIYQASSSEMYGNVQISPQDESTPFSPANPYAAAKVYAHQMANIYRKTYGMFIACGILFNHESPRRETRFVTQKVAYGAACIKMGFQQSPAMNEEGEPIVRNGKLSLGSLDVQRDWGYAPDYVQAMHAMLQCEQPDDFVIGTGVSRTIRDLCDAAFSCVGLNWQDHVITDPRFVRPIETLSTLANPAKAERELNWKRSVSFEGMISTMVKAHLDALQNELHHS